MGASWVMGPQRLSGGLTLLALIFLPGLGGDGPESGLFPQGRGLIYGGENRPGAPMCLPMDACLVSSDVS